MKHQESVKHIMSENLVTVELIAKFSEVKQLMLEHHLHHVPVIEGKKLAGIISIVDMLRVSHSSVFTPESKENDESLDASVSIKDVMTADPLQVTTETTIEEAAKLLNSRPFNSLPIVNDQGELVGLVTSTDLISYLIKQY